jgi:YbbR domain-containing protein
VPQGLEIAFIEPSRVRLAVEPILRRELPIRPDLIGETPAGYQVYLASVEPPRIAIEGPESEVRAVARLNSSPIRLDGHTTNFVQRVSASTDQPHVRVLESRPLEARVVIDTIPIERNLPEVAVTLASGTTGRLEPAVARVTLAGPEALLQRLDPRRVRVVADDIVAPRGVGPIPLALRVEFQDTPAEDLVRFEVRALEPQQVALHPRREAER